MKKRLSRSQHIIDMLLPLVLFFTFALGALCMVLFAARVYSEAARTSSAASSCQTAITYVTQKVRSGDAGGNIEIGTLDTAPALMIHEISDGNALVTCIYVTDGELTELLATEDAVSDGLTADAGTPVLKLSEMTFSEPLPGLLKITCCDDSGDSESTYIAVRSLHN